MLSFLPSPLLVILNLFLLGFWLALCGSWVFLCGLIKLIPLRPIQHVASTLSHWGYSCWIRSLKLTLKLTNNVTWQVSIPDGISPNGWYLLISNHRSWLDIVVLAVLFHKRIPLPKFFLKQELIWMPFLGLACWALDMPFMKRYSAAFLAKHPHLKGKDIETTRLACEKFKDMPTTVINFVEGTRCTPEKQRRSQSPFKHLLQPRAGGIAFTLSAMGDQFDQILNVSIAYPGLESNIMPLMLKGKLQQIAVNVEPLEITDQVVGDYFNDQTFRGEFQGWLNRLWQQKDKLLERLSKVAPAIDFNRAET